MMRRHPAAVLAPVAILVAATTLLGACGDDSSPYGGRSTTTAAAGETGGTSTTGADEPPEEFAALSAAFAPALDELGLELTRASVARLESGTHIALYGVPAAGDDSPQDYLDRLLPSTVAAGTIAFDTYGAVNSFDICQEPTGTTDDEPPPVTIVVLTRDAWESVPDWADADLADLLEATSTGGMAQLEVTDEISELPDYEAAVSET